MGIPDFRRADVADDATALYRYRIRSLETIRRTARDPRAFILHDIRDIERLSPPEIRITPSCSVAFPPAQSRLKHGKTCQSEEIVSSDKQRHLRVDLSSVGAELIQAHATTESIKTDHTSVGNKVPPHTFCRPADR